MSLSGSILASGDEEAESPFKPDPSLAGPRESAIAENLKVIAKQTLSIELEGTRRNMASLLKHVKTKVNSRAWAAVEETDKQTINAPGLILQIEASLKSCDGTLATLVDLDMSDPTSEEEMQPLREDVRTLKIVGQRYQQFAETMGTVFSVFMCVAALFAVLLNFCITVFIVFCGCASLEFVGAVLVAVLAAYYEVLPFSSCL